MIRDSSWALSLSPGASGGGNGAPGISAPDDAPRRLAVIDSPVTVPAGASLPGTIGYRLPYPCSGNQGNEQPRAADTDQAVIAVGPEQTPKWAFWIPATAAGLFIVDWISRRRRR